MTAAKNSAKRIDPDAEGSQPTKATARAGNRTPRTQEERTARARARMCKAALELFAIQGYHATSLGDIGLRAGYSRGLAHHYFGTREGLAEFLLVELGRRDTNTHLLQCDQNATGVEAWTKLFQHMEHSWKNFCSLYFDDHQDLAEQGELILRSTAALATDTGLQKKVQEVAVTLLDLVENALLICVRDDIVKKDIDIKKTAIFYIASIAGMSHMLHLGLIEQPSSHALIEPLRCYLNSLRTNSPRIG